MIRLVRLNEVQYAETEHQIAGLVAQGFVPVPLEVAEVKEDKPAEVKEDKPAEVKEDKPVKDGKTKKKAESTGKEETPPEGDEQH